MMNWNEPKVYAVKHKNSDVREASRSGGIFTAVSDEVLENGGVVYGCVLTENFEAIHVRAETTDERNAMRGSKYIQSSMGDVFKSVKKDLDEGSRVLFSGTSCQVAGLKGFLGKDYENLLCVDIVCHGVPSPLVWKKYLEWQENRNGLKVKSVNFRNKREYGWAAHVESIGFDNGKKIDSRVFTTLFYGHAIFRPCCYKCPYKEIMHPGDITIADYWGIDRAAPGFNDNKGVSLVLINDGAGRQFFEQVGDCLDYQKTRIEDSMQGPLRKPCDEPSIRNKFWGDFNKEPFDKIARLYGRFGVISKIKNRLKIIYNRT